MNKEDDVCLMMNNFKRLKTHLKLNYIKFLRIVLQRRYHNIDSFIESDIFGSLSENSQKKIKERKCFDLSIPVLCKLLMEDTSDKEKNDKDIKSLESVWRTHISENDDEMISSKIMQHLIERLNSIGERMVLRFPDVGEPHATNIQRFSPDVNENLVSTEKFEGENQLQDKNDDPSIVIHQFGDNNKIIFKLEDRRQLEVQSSGDVRVVLRSGNSEVWKTICDEMLAINLDDLNSIESFKESHIEVTSIERGCVVLNFNTDYAHPIKDSINRLLDAICEVLDVEAKMQMYNVPLLQVRGYIYYPEKFTKGPNSRTCPDLSIICHCSWNNSTTNCDVDIYVTSLMRNLIENNFSTDADEQIELQIKWYVDEKQECDITTLSYDVNQLLPKELRRMHLKIKEISENEKTINLSFKCTEQVAYVNFIGEGGIVSNITKIIFGNAWTSHWQISVFLDNHFMDDSVTGESLKISISPMPKDLKAVTKNNLSKAISAMLEGKGAAQPNSIGDLKIKAIIDYQEGSPEVNLQQVPKVALNTRVDLKATIRGFPRYQNVVWKKDKKNIDTTDPKYETSEDSNKNYAVLCIKSVKKEDAGEYTIEVQNQLGEGQSSQKLEVEGVQKTCSDLPKVTLNQIPPANVNECLEFKAVIESSPAYQKVIWTKDGEEIDIDEPKYEGSKKDAKSAVLCIKDVEEEDEGMYTIEVHNELGKGQSSQELKIIAEMIFISGPAVVSPSKTIFFQAYLSNRNPSKAKWWKIKDQLKTKITFDNRKFYFYQGSNDQNHKIEIHNAEKEDSATYELTVDCMKSNKLCVQVDDSGKYSNCNLGNCLRLFALQGVSAAAMRKVFDNLPGTFEDKLKTYSQYQSISKWQKEIISEPGRQLKSSEDVDITLMYRVIRQLYQQNPQNGWGNRPGKHDISTADDIERIRYCRNRICYTDASGMETNLFNESVLDLLGAIRRLSNGDLKLLEESCEFLNRAFTKEEKIAMMGKLEDFKQKQEKWNQSLQREECRDKTYEMIQFHDVCDSSIIIWENNSAATQILLHAGGVCFMNRPLNLGEEVHIRGSPHHLSFENKISIGLTNQDPKTIIGTKNKKKASKCELKAFNYCTCSETKHTYKKHCSKEFHIYICLCQKATLSICFNGTKQEYHSYKDVSTVHPLWLVIEPDRTETIWISNI